jgi:hypothetical protein
MSGENRASLLLYKPPRSCSIFFVMLSHNRQDFWDGKEIMKHPKEWESSHVMLKVSKVTFRGGEDKPICVHEAEQ